MKTINWFHFSNQFEVKALWRKFSIFLAERRAFTIKFTIVNSISKNIFDQKISIVNLKS